MKFVVLISLVFLVNSAWSLSAQLQDTVVGISPIKTEKYDKWDKKNSAIYDAKKELTFKLARKMMTAESLEENAEDIEKKVLNHSNLYILNSHILKSGVETDGDYESYQVRVKFDYSLENLRKLLKDKNILFKDLAEPKVMAFVEVMDESRLQVYKWWQEENPKLHPVLNPIQDRLRVALKERGYKLLEPQKFSNRLSAKEMAKKAGAHYYINGEVKVSYNDRGNINLSDGKFYFYETLSQKLVSKLDVMDFKKSYERLATIEKRKEVEELERQKRGVASVQESEVDKKAEEQEKPRGPQDVLTKSFRKAVDTMTVVGDTESLTQGLTLIRIKGVNTPRQYQTVKSYFSSLSDNGLNRVTERSLQEGEAVFLARSKHNASVLMTMLERQTPLTNGVLDPGTNGLTFELRRYN